MTAIIIPIYRNELNEYEWISLKQCSKVLSDYPIIFLTHSGIDVNPIFEALLNTNADLKISVNYFDKEYFKNVEGYNNLMLSIEFYERFINFEYILIHQLDAFLFKKDLGYWNSLGYDYIGAPWFKNWSEGNNDEQLWQVGNGGLSLRNIKSFLKILNKKGPVKKRSDLLKEYQDRNSYKKLLSRPIIEIKSLGFRNNISYYKKLYKNEDGFWGIIAKSCGLKVPLPLEALQFSFERNPRKLYEINKFRLPFGCHAWWRYDFKFWKPFIEQEGYVL